MQDLISLTIVALAAAYLGRIGWLRLKQKHVSTCGICGSCGTTEKPLVQIRMTHAEAQMKGMQNAKRANAK